MIDHHQPPGIAQVAPASVRGFLAVFHLDAVYGDAFFGVGDGVAVVSDGVGEGVGEGYVSPPTTTVTVLSSSGLGVAVGCGV